MGAKKAAGKKSLVKLIAPEAADKAAHKRAVAARRALLRRAKDVHPQLRAAVLSMPILPLPHQPRGPLVEVLARSIVGQQLSSKVARVFWSRLEVMAKENKQPLLTLFYEDQRAALRALGLSGMKIDYLCALREAHEGGRLKPALIKRASHEKRVAYLTAIKGIGRWTADMLGIFYCRDEDIWPDGDLAVREMFATLTGIEAKATPPLAAAFAPYRSYLALYMWHGRNNGVSID